MNWIKHNWKMMVAIILGSSAGGIIQANLESLKMLTPISGAFVGGGSVGVALLICHLKGWLPENSDG